MGKIQAIKAEFEKGNFDILKISVDTNAALSTVRVQLTKWRKKQNEQPK
jgi:alkyl hydroperoxide reductase subunit AhpC